MNSSNRNRGILGLIALVFLSCAAPPPKTDKVPSGESPAVLKVQPRVQMSTCSPLDEATLRALSGDDRISDDLNEPARTLQGDVSARGECNVSNVRRVVSWRSKQVLQCYDQMGQTDASGRVILRWEVTKRGKVAGLCMQEDGLKSAVLTNCLNRVIRLLRFEPPKGKCIVSWPFVFKRRVSRKPTR